MGRPSRKPKPRAKPKRGRAAIAAGQCPTPGKRSWDTEAGAASAAAYNVRTQGYRPYLCSCGSWHLTHNAMENKHRKHNTDDSPYKKGPR